MGKLPNYGWLPIIKYTPHGAGDKVLKAAWFAFYAFSSQFVFYWRWILRILNNLRGYQYLPNVFWISNESRIPIPYEMPFRALSLVSFRFGLVWLSLVQLPFVPVNSLKICCHTANTKYKSAVQIHKFCGLKMRMETFVWVIKEPGLLFGSSGRGCSTNYLSVCK